MRWTAAVGLAALALLGLGGTCSAPPPWHDVSGTWVNWRSVGGGTVTLEGSGAVGPSEVDLGLAGTYELDPGASTWVGSDYGGARLDVVARADDRRVVEVDQAFMVNSAPFLRTHLEIGSGLRG